MKKSPANHLVEDYQFTGVKYIICKYESKSTEEMERAGKEEGEGGIVEMEGNPGNGFRPCGDPLVVRHVLSDGSNRLPLRKVIPNGSIK